MNEKNDRRHFAKSRPLPPFGVILKWLVDGLQLRDLITYKLDADGLNGQNELRAGLAFLGSRTADDVFAGLMVKEETKQRMCTAFAACLRELPKMPFRLIPSDLLTAGIRDFWAAYERASGILSGISQAREQINRPLIRHAAVELAVRAGALAYLCNDPIMTDDVPIWSQDAELKQHLRELLKMVGSRDKIAEKLLRSQSEVDRWLDQLDIPPAPDIAKLETWIESAPGGSELKNGDRSLWRLFISRNLWQSVHEQI